MMNQEKNTSSARRSVNWQEHKRRKFFTAHLAQCSNLLETRSRIHVNAVGYRRLRLQTLETASLRLLLRTISDHSVVNSQGLQSLRTGIFGRALVKRVYQNVCPSVCRFVIIIIIIINQRFIVHLLLGKIRT